ncbi:MAG: class I SAM-dependent methyltransferase [Pyrinomonadaceae bacterium]
MTKTQKELAFLRDLYVGGEWTNRFTDLLDKNLKLSSDENLLYLNAGTGDHAFAVREKLGEDVAVFATCQDEDVLTIARDKAAAIGSDVDFSMIRFEDEAFDAVIADASLVPPLEIRDFLDDGVRVARKGGTVAIVLVTAGSFGEIFSLLWEVLFNEDLGHHGAAAERLIADQPTVSLLEDIAEAAGLENVKSKTAIEIFEFENGAEFGKSSLVQDFLLPTWLETLSEIEKEQVKEKLAQLIDAEDGPLTFRFSVKATLLTGEKA